MRKIIVPLAALLGGICMSSASVTVQGWWHMDSTQPINDSSGNNRTFGQAYSTAYTGGGLTKAELINNGVGGPLDNSGWTSTNCVLWGAGIPGGKAQAAMWAIGYNPPAQNYGIEIWVLPQDNGIAGGSGGHIFDSGSSGGVALRINAPGGDTPSYIDAFVVGTSTTIGNQVPINTNTWMHLAIINDAGVLTFYTNGVACGAGLTSGATAPAGDVYIGTPSDNQAYYGYLDEARMFTFAAGAFSTNDLLLRPAGPLILYPPQNASVWSGGAAPFSVTAAFDSSLLYQWQRGTTVIGGATSSSYLLPAVAPADSGSTFACKVTADGISVTTAPPATLTVIAPNAANAAAYRNVVTAEPSLLAYFPVDNCTGTTVTNVADASRSHDGTLEGNATYDGRTDRSFGQRALSFDVDGVVEVPNNSAFDFGNASSGNGTIEALVYLSQATVENPAIFSENYDGGTPYYALFANATGGFLVYSNDYPTSLTWSVPGGLVGQFAHIALVIDNGTNVTPYVNGQSLGTQVQGGFGNGPGGSFWIGGIGDQTTDNGWAGSIDELAIYGSALSAAAIQSHYTKFRYGTTNAPPTITSQPSSKTMLAGGSPQLMVTVGGALPFGYQWTSNGVPIQGATLPSLTLFHTTTNFTATYSLTITNVFGSTNTQPINLTFLAPSSGYVAKVMTDNPTAFWRLADSAGPTATDSAGLYDATYTASGVTYAAGGFPGDPGAGALFNGSSGRAVTPVNYPALNPNGPFTIEFWGSLTSYGFYVPISSMDRPARTGGYEYYIDGNAAGYEFHTATGGGYGMICADGNVPPNKVWTYVTGVWDTTNLYIYVNGQLGNVPESNFSGSASPPPPGTDNPITEGSGPFVPNTSFPFFIGSRSDNTHYWNGTLCDVAFYNYALTPVQITNHWSFGWVPAGVTQSPPGVTNVEGSTITLTPVVTGIPNTYQWYKGNTPLADSLNSDGTAHYANDITNLSLVIAEALPTDSGQYHLVVGNPLGGATSANATVLITADTNPPVVASVQALGTPNSSGGPTPFLVKVVFDERVDPTSGAVAGNYAINGSVSVTTATVRGDLEATSLGTDWRTVFLQTSGLTPGQQYTLTVSGVKDQAQSPNTIVPKAVTFTAPKLTQGGILWDYYYEITPQGVTYLQSDMNYPYAPATNGFLTTFDTTPITGGDLNNNPAFGSLGDNYGDVLSGWITPTVTGDYYFFISSDDASELDLSMDSTVVNALPIATESGCCEAFQEPGTSPTTSSLQHLAAGTSYFIRALHTEGGGGDYVKVAWRSSTDSTPAASLTPIPGQYLSAFVLSAPKFNAPVFSGGQLTLSWTGTGTLLGTTNVALPLSQWQTVTNASPYHVTPAASVPRMFYRLQ